MKIITRFSSAATILSLVIGLGGVAGFVRPTPAYAAASPSLGTAASFSILAGSEVTNAGASTVSGDIGISPGIGPGPHYVESGSITLGGTLYDADGGGVAAGAMADRNTAYAALAVPGCGTDGGADYTGLGIHELAGEILPPGVYCADSFHLTNGTLTLNGSSTDVWIFKSTSDLIITGAASDVLFTGGGLSCNVWWRVVSTATFDAGSAFVGNVLADTSITMAAGASLDGRALARTAEMTMVGSSVTGPTCSVPSSGSTSGYTGTITVVKTVVNDNGGTALASSFPLFINGVSVTSGMTNSFSFNNNFTPYTVSETSNAQYAQSFSGDCDANGLVYLNPAQNALCVITNNDIGAPVPVPPVPPLIDVVKVPSPLALPDGPGPVEYTYTARNIGTVPMTDVTMVGDTCAPIVLVSGDTNGDNRLDVTETWVHTCTTTLTETHTNTVVATGWANGLSAVDVASATVVVGIPLVPPLIHLTKVPSPLALSAGGGMVTYTETITNPGTVPLTNVTLSDDKCSPMKYISGDTNVNSLLDVTESWKYTCSSNLTVTTTNTAVATGVANGFTVRDFAIATVVVATAVAAPVVPSLPNTGLESTQGIPTWVLFAAGLVVLSSALYVARKLHQEK